MKKFLLLLVLLGATVFISYRYSGRVYNYYVKLYYTRFYTEREIEARSKKLYDQQKYRDLESYLNPALTVYPDNGELKKVAAYNYIRLGNATRAAELFATIDSSIIEENRVLEEFLKALYSTGNYIDLVYFYDRNIMRSSVNTAFYYGVSLYKNGRYDESLKSLMFAKGNTFMLPELYYYIGLVLDRKGMIKESAEYIKTAYEADRNNREYRSALINIYRKNGLFREAEILVRSR